MEALLHVVGYAAAVAAAAAIVIVIEALNERGASSSSTSQYAPRGLRGLLARLRQGRA
ncbi:MAG TPA: hypothetical protein VGU20_12015 [Stellaceae bacterium]|nr:hypothetical protein [Stellaceae bacterium]